jgi:hypothetical protein
VLDAGALLALEKRDRRMQALLQMAQRVDARIVIPAGALAQAWTGDARQAPIHLLLKRPTTDVPPLDRVAAEATGRLCRRSGTSDVVDAFVVIVAGLVHGVVVTSDPDDLRRLDPALAVEAI